MAATVRDIHRVFGKTVIFRITYPGGMIVVNNDARRFRKLLDYEIKGDVEMTLDGEVAFNCVQASEDDIDA